MQADTTAGERVSRRSAASALSARNIRNGAGGAVCGPWDLSNWSPSRDGGKPQREDLIEEIRLRVPNKKCNSKSLKDSRRSSRCSRPASAAFRAR